MPRIKHYGRAQLLRLLEQQCPRALARVPHPEEFEFTEDKYGTRLAAGTFPYQFTPYGGGKHYEVFLFCDGEQKPKLRFGGYPARGDRIVGNSFFGKLDNGDEILPSSLELAALVGFVFVYCGYKEEFANFHGGMGLQYLVSALNQISERLPDNERLKMVKTKVLCKDRGCCGSYERLKRKNAQLITKASPLGCHLDSSIETTNTFEGSVVESANKEEDSDRSELFHPDHPSLKLTASSKKRLVETENDSSPASKKIRTS